MMTFYGTIILLFGVIVEVGAQLKPGDACYAAPKYGTCPQAIVNQGIYPCTADGHCAGTRVCCNGTGGRKYCSDPFEDKDDACPDSLINPGRYDCFLDNNCVGLRKCCPVTPGSYCSMKCTDTTPATIPPTQPPDTPQTA